jgi:hypothetical protein
MRTVQLIRADNGRVIHTFVTDDPHPLEVYNSMLEEYGAQLVEGLGAVSTPIGSVVNGWIRAEVEREAAEKAIAAQAEADVDAIMQQHLGSGITPAPAGTTATAAHPMTLTEAAAAIGATMTASSPPPRVPAGHIDPRTTALGASRAPMPHRGDGTTSAKPSDDLIIRPGRADGLGKTEVLEVRGDGQLVKAPGWKPVQFEGEAVERASGPTEVLNENT